MARRGFQTLRSMNGKTQKLPICQPERLKKIEDFRRESKDLRTTSTANIIQMRRFFDSADAPLRMTDLVDCAFFQLKEGFDSLGWDTPKKGVPAMIIQKS